MRRRGRNYRVIPLLLPGIEAGALANWFDQEPVAVPVQVGPGGLDEALPGILAALGERLPDDYQPLQDKAAAPVEELLLTLTDPVIQHKAVDGMGLSGSWRNNRMKVASLCMKPARTPALPGRLPIPADSPITLLPI